MQGNGIGEEGAREIARALELNTRIAHLDIAVCWWKKGRHFMAAGWHLCGLMWMQGNGIGEGGARELARVLEHNPCITHLDIEVCWWEEGVCRWEEGEQGGRIWHF